MLDIDTRSVIYSVRNLLMPQDQQNFKNDQYPYRTARALMFSFDTRVSHRDSHENGKEQKGSIHVLIAGDQNAFITQGKITEVSEWENVSNHDSCWIDSIETALTAFYFVLCHKTDEDVAPRDLNQRTWFSVFGNSLKTCEVRMAPDDVKNKSYGSAYWKKIDSIKQISMDEFVAYRKEQV